MNIDNLHLHYQAMLNAFSIQFENQEFADCTLIAEGKSVYVHKVMLSAHSSFLKKLISDHDQLDLSFTIDGIRYDDLSLMVQFLYKGNVAVTSDQIASFLVTAELLGMKWLDKVALMSEQDSLLNNRNGRLLATKCSKSLPLKNITNMLTTKIHKRKTYDKSMKHCKNIGTNTNNKKSIPSKSARRTQQLPDSKGIRLETDLAQMDENTFCSMLGLKKNAENRDTVKRVDNSSSMTRKCVPPSMKIISAKSKILHSVEVLESCATNLVCESHPVFIEATNLSLLNIDANELCIRENNIEIECDVLDMAGHHLVLDRENAGFVRMSEEVDDETRAEHGYRKRHHHHNTIATADGTSSAQKRFSSRKKSAGKRSGRVSSTTVDKSYDGVESTIFWCDVCQRTYHTKTGLNQHKRYECCKDPAFSCPRCEKRFKRKSSLVRHAITLHNEAVYPTRTKLLSKLTSPRTIAGKR